MRRLLAGVILCVLFVSVLGVFTSCAPKKQVKGVKFPPEGETATVPPGGPGALGAKQPGGVEEQGIPQEQAVRNIAFQPTSELKSIYFAFDSSALTPESRATLEAAARWLKDNPKVKVQAEGNCDERGTVEYNLALGERRALAARRYLLSLGIDANRITTLSYGKEKPVATCHDESCWKQNRRDDFKISVPK